MRRSLCRSCLASLLKLLNFLQTFVGVSIILYSAWILNQRNKLGDGFIFDLDKLPAHWFVCALMGFGILVCLIAFTGHVAAEAISGCCLCSYTVFTAMLISLEAVLAGEIVFNKHWQEDLPYDSTAELKRLRSFVEDNIDICAWVAVTIVVIQVLSLLVAMILRGMVSGRRMDYDSDEDFVVIRRPLLYPQGGSTFPSAVDGKGYHSDIWSSRMREKQLKWTQRLTEAADVSLPTASSTQPPTAIRSALFGLVLFVRWNFPGNIPICKYFVFILIYVIWWFGFVRDGRLRE